MGDWNTSAKDVDGVYGWKPEVKRISVNGDPKSFKTKKEDSQRGDIDHVAVDRAHASIIKEVRVDRSWDYSDHWPVITTMDAREYTMPVTRPCQNAFVMKRTVNRSVGNDNNMWNVLRDMNVEEDDDVDAVVNEFTETSFTIAKRRRLATRTSGLRKASIALSRQHRNLLRTMVGKAE